MPEMDEAIGPEDVQDVIAALSGGRGPLPSFMEQLTRAIENGQKSVEEKQKLLELIRSTPGAEEIVQTTYEFLTGLRR